MSAHLKARVALPLSGFALQGPVIAWLPTLGYAIYAGLATEWVVAAFGIARRVGVRNQSASRACLPIAEPAFFCSPTQSVKVCTLLGLPAACGGCLSTLSWGGAGCRPCSTSHLPGWRAGRCTRARPRWWRCWCLAASWWLLQCRTSDLGIGAAGKSAGAGAEAGAGAGAGPRLGSDGCAHAATLADVHSDQLHCVLETLLKAFCKPECLSCSPARPALD